jgi:hypothetical protein
MTQVYSSGDDRISMSPMFAHAAVVEPTVSTASMAASRRLNRDGRATGLAGGADCGSCMFSYLQLVRCETTICCSVM